MASQGERTWPAQPLERFRPWMGKVQCTQYFVLRPGGLGHVLSLGVTGCFRMERILDLDLRDLRLKFAPCINFELLTTRIFILL